MTSRSVLVSIAVCACALFAVAGAQAQITITAPTSGAQAVGSAEDYATQMFQDPWDMDKRTDLGWFSWGEDLPSTNLSNRTLSNGVFSGVPTNGDPNIWLLDTHTPGFGEFGRVGSKYRIDGTRYKVLMLRMKLAAQPASLPGGTVQMQVFWSNNTFHSSNEFGVPITNGGFRTSAGITIPNEGWWIHYIDLSTLAMASASDPLWPGTGAGTVDSLRIDPTQYQESGQIDLDWVRLTTLDTSTYRKTITWTSGSSVDIFLATNSTCTQDLAQIANDTSGGSFNFYVGGLPPGDYYVGMRAGSSTGAMTTCSTGYYRVAGVPTMAFTSPSEEGSADDFGTVQLNRPWDMNALSDVEYSVNVSNPVITTVNAEDEAGNSLGAVRVLKGTSPPAGAVGVEDPYMYLLWLGSRTSPWGSGVASGADYRIDADRYRILTFEMGVNNSFRKIANGSHARIIWHVAGDYLPASPSCAANTCPAENVSVDVILNHIGGRDGSAGSPQVIPKIIMDMKDTPNEGDLNASPSVTGWVNGSTSRPGIDSFRLDPHEFNDARDFYLRRVKLAAFERFASTYAIQWTFTNPTSDAFTISFFYDTDRTGFNGTAITECGGLSPTAGTCNWVTTGSLTTGTSYYIYSEIKSGGTVVNRAYARWPVIKDPSPSLNRPRMSLDRSLLNFGGSLNGQQTTNPQPLTLTITGTGAGSVQWTATPINSDGTPLTQFVSVSPSSGTGSGTINVSIIASNAYPDALSGDWGIRVVETTAGTTANSPQYARAHFQMYAPASRQAPFGAFDTPTGAETLQGSFAVTGWALDDIEIQRVEIWRDKVAGETTPVYSGSGPGNGKIFIANPLFVYGSRTDIEGAYPTSPFSARGGWGYMLLSWGLWAQGNGTYTLYAFAYDVDGHSTTLGTKTITVSNATATKPFGAIDTPTYGGTVSGSFWNFGWALTPNATPTCTIMNGSVQMNIDSGPFVTVNYGDLRTDIAASFPGFSNGNNSGGAYYVDSTAYTNGVHTIGWLVYDNCGRGDGVGSRFFTVLNSATDAPAEAEPVSDNAARAEAPGAPGVNLDPISVRRTGADWQPVPPDISGDHIIEVAEGERIEVQLPGHEKAVYKGSQVVLGGPRALPLGSSLDAAAGIFYWQPAAGFLGSYDLVFTPRDGSGLEVRVRVVVGPPMRAMIDTPQPGELVDPTFVLAGWALDLASSDGAGIDSLHVWAYPAGGGKPRFLGIAEHGGARPDVERVYGARFANSSFSLAVQSLAPGTYDIVVYPHRAKTDAFDGAQLVRVTVR